MSINLLHGRKVFLPKVPDVEDAQVKEYLSKLSDAVENIYTKLVDNDGVAVAAINTGTSGTFDDSAGNTITIVDGIITSLT